MSVHFVSEIKALNSDEADPKGDVFLILSSDRKCPIKFLSLVTKVTIYHGLPSTVQICMCYSSVIINIPPFSLKNSIILDEKLYGHHPNYPCVADYIFQSSFSSISWPRATPPSRDVV